MRTVIALTIIVVICVAYALAMFVFFEDDSKTIFPEDAAKAGVFLLLDHMVESSGHAMPASSEMHRRGFTPEQVASLEKGYRQMKEDRANDRMRYLFLTFVALVLFAVVFLLLLSDDNEKPT